MLYYIIFGPPVGSGRRRPANTNNRVAGFPVID